MYIYIGSLTSIHQPVLTWGDQTEGGLYEGWHLWSWTCCPKNLTWHSPGLHVCVYIKYGVTCVCCSVLQCVAVCCSVYNVWSHICVFGHCTCLFIHICWWGLKSLESAVRSKKSNMARPRCMYVFV